MVTAASCQAAQTPPNARQETAREVAKPAFDRERSEDMAGQKRWARRGETPAAGFGPASTPMSDSPEGRDAFDHLLNEVRELRLTFVADLSSAAGAVSSGAPEVAAEILDADSRELARFFRAADERLRELEEAAYRPAPSHADVVALPAGRSAVRRRLAVALPVVPLVGALSMAAAAATGLVAVPGVTSHAASHSHVAVAATAGGVPALRQFESVVNGDPSAQQVIAAADKLHQQIVALIANSDGDPQRTSAIAQLLQIERQLLLTKQPPGAQAVLAATRSLITQLNGHSATKVESLPKPTSAPVAPASSAPQPSSKPSPTPSKTTTPSPKPTHSPSSSPSPSPSSSGSSGTLPKVGG
jgi:hypothetical protein